MTVTLGLFLMATGASLGALDTSKPLGEPLGPPVRDGYVYTHSYEHVDVWVDVSTKETVLVREGDTDGDGLPNLWENRNFGGETNAVGTQEVTRKGGN